MKNRVRKIDSPRTKLRFKELLGALSITKLAKRIDVPYTQLYRYKRVGANPTLLILEKLADGLSELRGETIQVRDLIDEHNKKRRAGR